MYTHARQFPHLAGRADDEIRALARRAMARHPRYVLIRRMRNVIVLLGMFVTIPLLERRTGLQLGSAMMIAGGAASALLLLWNVVWVNTVLFRVTQEESTRGSD